MTEPAQDAAADGGIIRRWIGAAANVRPAEMRVVGLAFLLNFMVLGGYFAARPIRETIGTVLGNDVVKGLYLWTWVFSIAIIPVYGALVAKIRRSTLLPWVYGFLALALAAVGWALRIDENNPVVGSVFYVGISVLNLFIVSVFWAFLLEVFNSEQSKRVFGAIAAGGTAGALIGPFVTSIVVSMIGNSGILFMSAAAFVVAIVCQRALIAQWNREGLLSAAAVNGAAAAAGGATANNIVPAGGSAGASGRDRAIGGNPFAGFSLVLKSPYLLAIAALVALAAAATTFLYFEQLRIVKEAFPDKQARTQVFATLDAVVQGFAILSQIFLTGRIATRLGLVVLLTIVPVAMIFGFLALAAVGTFSMLATVFVMRRAGEYAFVRLGREMLFSRVDNEVRYKAKSAIDVPVYRGADALAAQLKGALESAGMSPKLVMLIGAGIAAVWAFNGWWLGRRHDRANPIDR